jgi:hypothetical protein
VPIHAVPPPIVIRPKPPSLESLGLQLVQQQQILAAQQAGLASAQAELAYWMSEDNEVGQLNTLQWTNAVNSAENTIAAVQRQISALLAQIAATP